MQKGLRQSLLQGWFLCAFLLAHNAVALESEIAADEQLQFFPTAAIYNEATETWRIPIHGWVYEPERSFFRKLAFEQALAIKFDLKVDNATRGNFDHRLSLLIADNERNKDVVVLLGGESYEMPASAPSGHFVGEIELSDERARALAQDGFIHYRSQARDERVFTGSSLLLPAQGLSVISDIDDTVKVTDVLDQRALLKATFLQDFVAVPGMAKRYRRLEQIGARFHFVSSSPWQLFPPLLNMVRDEDFPWATFHLNSVRFRDSSVLNLFKPGTETKPLQIEALLKDFPQREFVLIGDSGEADPEVYADILRDYPERIRHIYIRNITGERLDNARFQPLVDKPEQWTLFTNPEQIALPRVE